MVESGWTTLDGQAFGVLLKQGADNLEGAARQVDRIASRFERYAAELERAQALIDRARELAERHELEVHEGLVLPPAPVQPDPYGGPHVAPEQPAFVAVTHLVHKAMDIINPDTNFLDKLAKELASGLSTAGGDFVAGAAEEVGDRYLAVFTMKQVGSGVEHGAVAVRMRVMLRLMEKYGHLHGGMPDLVGPTKAEILSRAGRSLGHFTAGAASGIVWKIAKYGGHVLTIYGFVKDVQEGTPVDTAAVGAGIGALAGWFFAGAVAGGPAGVTILVSVASGIAFGSLAKAAYEEFGPDHRPVVIDEKWYAAAWEPR